MKAKRFSAVAVASLLLTLILVAGNASAGNDFEVDCWAGNKGAGATSEATSSGGAGTMAYASADAVFILSGTKEKESGPHNGGTYSWADAEVNRDFRDDRAVFASSKAEAEAGSLSGEAECRHSSLPEIEDPPSFQALPEWVRHHVLDLACTWSWDAPSYTYSGTLYYHNGYQATYLDQSTNVVNLTGVTDFASGLSTLTTIDSGSTVTDVKIDSFGDETTGCRLITDLDSS